jgi:hypothetical protein
MLPLFVLLSNSASFEWLSVCFNVTLRVLLSTYTSFNLRLEAFAFGVIGVDLFTRRSPLINSLLPHSTDLRPYLTTEKAFASKSAANANIAKQAVPSRYDWLGVPCSQW